MAWEHGDPYVDGAGLDTPVLFGISLVHDFCDLIWRDQVLSWEKRKDGTGRPSRPVSFREGPVVPW